VKTEEFLGAHYIVDILPPFTSVDIIRNPCCYGKGIGRRRLLGKNTDELNDASVSDTDTLKRVRYTSIPVRAAILQNLRRQWDELEQLLIWLAVAVSEDIDEQHALVVVGPAQAPANGHLRYTDTSRKARIAYPIRVGYGYVSDTPLIRI
jgi:hypothetical protein